MLLKSLMIIGAILGVILGSIGVIVLRCFPGTFTSDYSVIREVSSSSKLSGIIVYQYNHSAIPIALENDRDRA